MQKTFYLVFIFFFVSLTASSQSRRDEEFFKSNYHQIADEIITPTVYSPEVSSFAETTILPTDLFVGKVNIEVPLYTLELKNLSIPVLLKYNSGGVKVADMASNYGLNWSLLGGGVVLRKIKHLSDYRILQHQSSGGSKTHTPAGWLYKKHPDSNLLISANNPNNDALPDVFSISAPGLNTSFIFDRNAQVKELSAQRNKIEVKFDRFDPIIKDKKYLSTAMNWGVVEVTVTTLKGIRYEFNMPEIVVSKTRNETNAEYDNRILNFGVDMIKLKSIEDLSTGQKVVYKYEKYIASNPDKIRLVERKVASNRNFSYKAYRKTNIALGNRLSKIILDNGEVEVDFSYNTAREDFPDEKRLDEVQVKNRDHKIVKKWRFDYSYFISSIDPESPQGKRLKLNKVYELDNSGVPKPGYQFTYHEEYPMPPRDTYAYDFLGYNNGSYSPSVDTPENNARPKLYFKDFRITPFKTPNSIYIPGNFSLLSNLNYAKTYTLKEIKTPTGGKQTFNYELNTIDYYKIIKGGGLRIASQEIVDENGDRTSMKYEYSDGRMGYFPQYATYELLDAYEVRNSFSNLNDLLSYLYIEIYSTPKTAIQLNKGSFVAYGYVTEKYEGVRNGLTKYTYSYFEDAVPDKEYSPGRTYNSDYGKNWGRLTHNRLTFSNDYKRGKLLSKEIYNSSDIIVIKETNSYREDEMDHLDLTYYNWVVNPSSTNPYLSGSGKSKYNSYGGVKEILKYPMSRYLKHLHTVEEYGTGGDEMYDRGLIVQTLNLYDPYFPLLTESLISNYLHREDGDKILWESKKICKYPAYGNPYEKKKFWVNKNYAYAKELVNSNRIALPMEIEISGRKYSKKVFEYKPFSSGYINLNKIKKFTRDSLELPTMSISKRDLSSNIIEIQNPNGSYISIIYGYGNTSIVAIINGVRRNELDNWLFEDYGMNCSSFNEISINESEEVLLKKLDDLRKLVNEKANDNTVSVNTYTHDPLIGVKSITDQRGIRTYYDRDQSNRLKTIRNNENQILELYNYHFKN
ncbi:hypothetical protein [Zunongwangia sp.]|uniref:hypothetical protein n=1 Tax=Zunongwangia sp. TaxID=1965325 RepID=UPI003AA95B6C